LTAQRGPLGLALLSFWKNDVFAVIPLFDGDQCGSPGGEVLLYCHQQEQVTGAP